MKRILLLAGSFIILCSFMQSGITSGNLSCNKFSDSGEIKKVLVKSNVVKLFPNPSSTGKVSVTTNVTGPLHFYIFDLEGTMMYQTVLTKNDKKDIENLKKGTYTYDVFEKEESIEEGKIIIK